MRRFVLNAISDDYENIDQVILAEVSKDTARCGLKIERLEVVEALSGLIRDGFAKAYILSGTEPYCQEITGIPKVDEREEDFKTYFYITLKGSEFQTSHDAWWPFDDEDNLRPDWLLESAT